MSGHSSDVEIKLRVRGFNFVVAQVGRDSLITAGDVDLFIYSGDVGEIDITVDGDKETSLIEVLKVDGKLVEFKARCSQSPHPTA